MGVSHTLRRRREGATYIRQGDHDVGHWPTFYFRFSFIPHVFSQPHCSHVTRLSSFNMEPRFSASYCPVIKLHAMVRVCMSTVHQCRRGLLHGTVNLSVRKTTDVTDVRHGHQSLLSSCHCGGAVAWKPWNAARLALLQRRV